MKADFRSFSEIGFRALPGVLAPASIALFRAEIDRLDARARALLADRAPGGPAPGAGDLIVVPERDLPTEVCRYEAIAETSPLLRELFVSEMARIVAGAIGEPVALFKNKMNRKGPGGGAFPPHQDFAAYRHFAPRYNVTALVPIDPMTLENGCVQFATDYRSVAGEVGEQIVETVGGLPLFATHGPGPRNGDIVDAVSSRLSWQPVEAKIGDIVVFDSFVPHFSLPNRTTATRRALFVTFTRAAEGDWYAHYYRAKRADAANPMFHISTPTVHDVK